jgi:phosphoserine phosphatase
VREPGAAAFLNRVPAPLPHRLTGPQADLIVQAPGLPRAAVDALAARVRAAAVEPIAAGGPTAYRLRAIAPGVDVAAACAGLDADCALLPAGISRGDVRVLAMDMDSTLITIECIDEIADMQGLKPEVAAITASAMRGEIDFRESLTRRVRLLAGLPVAALERVYAERLRLSPGAEAMVAGFRAAGARLLLVSGGFTFFTDRLRDRLGFDDVAANVLDIVGDRLSGRIVGEIVDAAAKAARLRALRERHAVDGGLAVAIGDGANDLPMLAVADVSIAYHAKPVVRAQATLALDHCGLDALLNLFP